MLKKIFLLLAATFVILQFIRPTKNQNGDTSQSIEKKYPMPQKVALVLKKACNDCHSNNTEYPWYSNIQPLGWWINHHVEEGKEELNFDAFLSYKPKKQDHKLEECIEMVEENEMPLSSYTITHKDAILTKEEKSILIDWFRSVREQINP